MESVQISHYSKNVRSSINVYSSLISIWGGLKKEGFNPKKLEFDYINKTYTLRYYFADSSKIPTASELEEIINKIQGVARLKWMLNFAERRLPQKYNCENLI